MKYYGASLAVIVALLLAVNVSALNSYTHTYYSTNTSATLGSIEGASVIKDEGCTATLTERGSFAGTNFDIGVNYYSPDSTLIGTATRTGLNSLVCSSFGEYSTSSDLSNFYEGGADYTATASSGNLTLTTVYSCDETSLYYQIVGDMNDIDSFGNVPYRYGGTSTGFVANATLASYAYDSNYNQCFSDLVTRPPYIYIGSAGTSSADYRRTAYAYYPFNSGTEGIVSYWFNLGNASVNVMDCTDSCTGTQSGYFDVYLVNVEDESYVSLYSDSGDCLGGYEVTGELEGSLNLDSDTEYMFVTASRNDDAGVVFPCSRSYAHREPLAFNISVYVYEPDWNCSAWSACVGGEQLRTCNDLNGIATPKTEFRTCDIDVAENATLGFEDFVRDSDIYMCIPQFSINPFDFGCVYDINTTYRDSPANWTVVENQNLKRHFLGMTQDWSSEGSRSLRMWYIPPKMGEPISNTTCGNQTIGTIPAVYQPENNDTFSVLYNVTFPAEDMIVAFDVKGCTEQQHQHWGIKTMWSANTSLFTFCEEQCYAGDCDSTPLARYSFNIINANTSQSVIGTPYYGNADNDLAQTIQIDLTNLGLEAGYDYNLVFSVYPENLQDQRGDCVMFDNVNYYVLNTPYIDILGGVCESRCVGNVFYEAKELSNGECSVIRKAYATECVTDEEAEAISNLEDYCLDSDTLAHYNSRLAKYEEINCENGCTDASCVSAEEAEEAEQIESLYLPHPIIQDLLTEWGCTYANYAIIWFFVSIFMCINYIALIAGLSAGTYGAISGGWKEPKNFYIPFLAVVIIILVSTTFGGWYPLEVGIPIVVFIGILLWKTSEGIIGGKGGN